MLYLVPKGVIPLRSRGVVPTCDRTLGPAGVQHPHTGRASHPIRRTDRHCRLTAIGTGGGIGIKVLRWAAARPPLLNRNALVAINADLATEPLARLCIAPTRLSVTVSAPSHDDPQVESRIKESGV